MGSFSSIVVLLIAALLVREMRVGNRLVASDPSVELQPNHRFRTLRMQAMEPLLALVVVGSLLATDLERSPVHLGVAAAGGIAGYAFGVYRARATYVAAAPAHRGVVLRYSIESFVALGLLLVIKLVAELNVLPDREVFRAIIAGLLGFLLVESAARVITLFRYYRRDAAAPVVEGAEA